MAFDSEHFINWFRNSAPYIHAHRGRTFVLMIPGEAILDKRFETLVHDIALLNSLGIRLILVHGARPQINQRLASRGIDSQYQNNLRITDKKELASVKDAVGHIRVEIEALLSQGLSNTPMSGARIRTSSGNFVIAKPIGIHAGIDFKQTGHVRRIDKEAINSRLDAGDIVLLSPIGYSPTGEVFNINAEEVACAAAIATKAHKLILMMEHNQFVDSDNIAVNQIALDDAIEMLKAHNKPALKKLLGSAVTACEGGVQRAHLIDYHVDGSLLIELFSRDGCGVLINANSYDTLRVATIDDVMGIIELIKPLEDSGILVKRSRECLETELKHFSVIERDGLIIGCAALYPYHQEGYGELACLSIHPDYHRQGKGELLVKHIEGKAHHAGLDKLFVLTTQSQHWFLEIGFAASQITDLPIKKQNLYNYQRNSKVFIKSIDTCVRSAEKLKY